MITCCSIALTMKRDTNQEWWCVQLMHCEQWELAHPGIMSYPPKPLAGSPDIQS